jgi:hypothetical protein
MNGSCLKEKQEQLSRAILLQIFILKIVMFDYSKEYQGSPLSNFPCTTLPEEISFLI